MRRGMSIRFKVLTLSALVLATFLIAAELVLMRVIAPNFTVADEARALDRVRMVVGVLERDIKGINAQLLDWSQWDDTYAFVSTRDPGYATSNLGLATFSGTNLDVLLITNAQGDIVWSGEYDRPHDTVIQATSLLGGGRFERIRDLLESRMETEADTKRAASVHGLIETPRGPLMVALRPILTSTADGPPRGVMAMGRLLSQKVLDDIGGLLDLTVSAFAAKTVPASRSPASSPSTAPPAGSNDSTTVSTAPPVAADSHEAGRRLALASDTGLTVGPGSTNRSIAAYAAVNDLFGAPLIILQTDIPKQAELIGHNALRVGVALIAATGLMLIVVFLLCLQQLILSPLATLTNHIRNLTNRSEIVTTLPNTRHDEFGRLAEAFNDMQQRIACLAYFDTLTGLPNRRMLEDRAEHLLRIAKRTEQKVAVLFLDLDGFKAINDSKGHAMGDCLLKAVGMTLTQMIRDADTVGRIGGDEFVIVMHNPGDPSQVEELANRILERFRQPFHTSAGDLFVGVSVGISLYPEDGTDFDSLSANADTAMYQAKAAGGDRAAFLNSEQHRKTIDTLDLTQAFHEAVLSDQLALAYQPQIDLATGAIIRHEALARWIHPQKGVMQAKEFIHRVNSGTLFSRFDDWALKTACISAAGTEDGNDVHTVAVNITPQHLVRGDLVGLVRRTLEQSGLSPNALVLEVAATGMLTGQEQATKTLQALREMGVSICVDGFGTEAATLSDLQHIPADIIKIHGSIVRAAPQHTTAAAGLRGIVTLGRELKLEVIAEGIETEEQLELARSLGCNTAQGYFIGPAVCPQISQIPSPQTPLSQSSLSQPHPNDDPTGTTDA